VGKGKGRSADVTIIAAGWVLVGVLVLCPAVPWMATECHALSCLDEMIIAGEDQYDDWGCAVDVTPDGRAWVVWTGHDTLDYDEEVYYTIYDSDGWSQPGRVHPDNDVDDRVPRISVGSDGVPWVIWRGLTDVGYGILATRWTGSAWSPAEVVRGSVDRWAGYDLLARGQGDVWVAVEAGVAGSSYSDVLVYHRDGLEWHGPWQVGLPDRGDGGPDFGLDPEGAPWIVWESRDYDAHMSSILCSAWSDTGWSAPSVVNADSGNIGSQQIVFDGRTPLVVWTGNGHIGTGTDLEYSLFRDGSWTPSALASQPDGLDDYDKSPVCESSPSGDIRLCWWAGNSYLIWSAAVVTARWRGSDWGAELQVSVDTTRKRDTYPDMALTPSGEAWFAWTCYHETGPPYDEDIRGTFCSEMTPVSFGAIEATPCADGTEVRICWYASGEARDGPFHVWRAIATPGSPEGGPEPGESAERLTSAPITGPPYEWIDRDVTTGTGYLYWVGWTQPHGDIYLGPASACLPGSIGDLPARLLYALPNPSAGGARIAYEQGIEGTVGVDIFDVSGRKITSTHGPGRPPGRYDGVDDSIRWDGRDERGNLVASGVYLVQLTMNGAPVPGQRSRITVLN
jgi:hypothetical protein